MTGGTTRRGFLAITAALAASPALAAEPLIIRPDIEGVDPRYRSYATRGRYIVPSVPTMVTAGRQPAFVYYPRQKKSGRLVVFSHNALSDPGAYAALLSHWASHGFVVAAPVHRDALTSQGSQVRQDVDGVTVWDVTSLAKDPATWTARAAQCSAIAASAAEIGQKIGMEVLVDRPIAAGHGFGAHVAQLLVGAAPEGAPPTADQRFFSAILLSPPGRGVLGLGDGSWSSVRAPLLSVIAEKDSDYFNQGPDAKGDAYGLSSPGYKHLALLRGAGQDAFTSAAGAADGTGTTPVGSAVLAITTAFARAYGDYEQQAFDDLSTDFFERMTLGKLDESRR